jgi:hypothetical protein
VVAICGVYTGGLSDGQYVVGPLSLVVSVVESVKLSVGQFLGHTNGLSVGLSDGQINRHYDGQSL